MTPLVFKADTKMPARLLRAMQRDGGTNLDDWIRKTLLAASARRKSLPPPAASSVPLGYRRWKFSGTLDAQQLAKTADVIAYIHDAVGTMCGCYRPPCAEDPGDPMWRTSNVQSVKVRLAPRQ